jgi:hypothetical protein
MVMIAESGGGKGYEAYFGESGSLTRKRRIYPDSITRETGMREYTLVNIWEESGKILHGRTEDGKAYQHLLLMSILYFEPYKEVSKGKLMREKTVDTRPKTKT